MPRAIFLVVLGLAALAVQVPPATAGTVGVVVTGDPELQPPLVTQLEGWLRGHGHEVVPMALDPASVTRLIDCFTLDDSSCARKLVEARSSADSVVFARAVRDRQAVNLSVSWIVKGRPPAGAKRGCEPCTTDVLLGDADELMASLAAAATGTTGRLILTSKPEGLIVLLDGAKLGVTPLERDIATGTHTLTLLHGGARVAEQQVQISAGATATVAMKAGRSLDGDLPPPPGPSRLPPVLCWVGGAGAIAGGAVALYYGRKDGPEEKYVYPGATPAGIALVSAGAVSIGVGVWLWVRGSRESSRPVAAIGPGGGYLGWHGRF